MKKALIIFLFFLALGVTGASSEQNAFDRPINPDSPAAVFN